MELRKYDGHVGTSPTTLDCSSRFTKAFFCRDFIPELWSRIAVNLQSKTETVTFRGERQLRLNMIICSTSNSHTVIDNEGSWEAHYVRDGHEGYELGEVHKELWGHSRELVNESSSHCFHGL